MTKTYYIVTFKNNGEKLYFATAKKARYKDGVTDIFLASWYDKLSSAKTTVTQLKMYNQYRNTKYTDIKIVEYTVTLTKQKETQI